MTFAFNVRGKLKGALAFVHHEAAGGLVLMLAALAALIASNSPLAWLYDGFLGTPVGVRVGPLAIDKPLLLWINDGLMAVFFFLIGLEIKRELLRGELSTLGQAALPALGAVGGMAVPAVIYVAINAGDPEALRGWAIPTATDIAFSVGVLALLGSRIPASLKIFLLALAIVDDLAAIVIIALFYTEQLSPASLVLAAVGAAVLWALNARGVNRPAPYVLTGILIWVCVLKSGVHATLAGAVVALAIPMQSSTAEQPSLLEQLEDSLHPWVAFAVLPLFAFANAGVSLQGVSVAKLLAPVPLGIALGLVLGKPLGILGAVWLAVKGGLASRPQNASWGQVMGIGMLGGIGFTMSLFIGTLAFPDPSHAAQVRLGVLAGSLLSAVTGFLLLRALPGESEPPAESAQVGSSASEDPTRE
jgi:NhaA family Na+:H+ antiporter